MEAHVLFSCIEAIATPASPSPSEVYSPICGEESPHHKKAKTAFWDKVRSQVIADETAFWEEVESRSEQIQPMPSTVSRSIRDEILDGELAFWKEIESRAEPVQPVLSLSERADVFAERQQKTIREYKYGFCEKHGLALKIGVQKSGMNAGKPVARMS